MPIEVDTTEAPALLRFRCVGALPMAEEQEALRHELVDQGLLTSARQACSFCVMPIRQMR